MSKLTARELSVAQAISRGLSNCEVGRELGISESTVKHHVKSVMQKLDVNSRHKITIWALAQPDFRGESLATESSET